MAHSWGTVVGMGAALERPDLFHAYVGIGQVINVRDNERISFEYGLAQAREHGNAEAIAELESIAPYPGDQPITRERIIIARKWPQFYGGMTAYRDGPAKSFFGAPLLSPEYDAADERWEEHTSEHQSLMRTASAVFCLQKKTTHTSKRQQNTQ